jgi:RNA-directed DNA polymerase
LMRKYQRGEMDWQAVNQSVQSYFGILKHCNSYGLRNAIFGPDGWFVLQRGETECFEQYSWTFRGWIFHSL